MRPEWDAVQPACVQPAIDVGLEPFTLRVLNAISHGLTNAEAAVVLGISLDQVKTELARARRALAAKNTAHAIARAFRHGLL